MPYATWLPDVLHDAGLVVNLYPGWQTRGGSTFSPRGVMLHHTVTSPTTDDWLVDRMLAETGSSTTPPPLANYSTNRDGSVSIIAAGTANHGGAGSWRGVSGNRYWFGDEMKNRGTTAEPWPQRQLESAYRAAAVVLTHIGRDASWLMGHKEYATPPGRKVDPHTLNMNTVRSTVQALIDRKEDVMTPAQEAKLDQVLALVDSTPSRVLSAEFGGPHGSANRRSLALHVLDIRKMIGALDSEGVSEAELDERVSHLIEILPDRVLSRLRDRLG